MNRKLAATLLAAGIASGGVAASTTAAFADETNSQTSATTAAATQNSRAHNGWMKDAIKPLVENGTLNQSQSDAVVKALDDARPRGRGQKVPPDHTAVAALFGMSVDEFQAATRDANKSIATLAKEKNVDLQKVIDAMITSHNARVDENLQSGKLTQAQADAMKANASTHITEIVNSSQPPRGNFRNEIEDDNFGNRKRHGGAQDDGVHRGRGPGNSGATTGTTSS